MWQHKCTFYIHFFLHIVASCLNFKISNHKRKQTFKKICYGLPGHWISTVNSAELVWKTLYHIYSPYISYYTIITNLISWCIYYPIFCHLLRKLFPKLEVSSSRCSGYYLFWMCFSYLCLSVYLRNHFLSPPLTWLRISDCHKPFFFSSLKVPFNIILEQVIFQKPRHAIAWILIM